MPLVGFVKSLGKKDGAQLRGALVRDRSLAARFKLTRNGVEGSFDLHTKTAIDLSVLRTHDFNSMFTAAQRRQIDAAIRAAADQRFLIEVSPAEAVNLQQRIDQLAAHLPLGVPVFPICDYVSEKGVLVPRAAAQALLECSPTMEMTTMSTLNQDAPRAYAYIKGLCDDSATYVNEVLVYFYMKSQHKLTRTYVVRGSKGVRPKTLTDADIDKFVLGVGETIAKRHYAELTSPAIEPLGDAALAVVPAYHQPEDRNSVLLVCAIHYGAHDAMLRVDMEEHAPAISNLLLQELGRSKPKALTAAPIDCVVPETRAVN